MRRKDESCLARLVPKSGTQTMSSMHAYKPLHTCSYVCDMHKLLKAHAYNLTVRLASHLLDVCSSCKCFGPLPGDDNCTNRVIALMLVSCLHNFFHDLQYGYLVCKCALASAVGVFTVWPNLVCRLAWELRALSAFGLQILMTPAAPSVVDMMLSYGVAEEEAEARCAPAR